MMDKVEMSLDEIIKSSKDLRNPRGRRGGRGGFRRGGSRINETGGVGKIRTTGSTLRRGSGFGSARTPFSRSPGDINSRWQHDMYEGPAFNKRRVAPTAVAGGPSKLLVSNLDYGVSNSDIQELFTEFGPLKSANVNYDKSGRSMGSANVVFERRSDAVKAMKQYNGVPLDGRPMHIELTTSDVGAVLKRVSLGGGFGRRGGVGVSRGSSRGAGRGGGFRRGGGGGRGRGGRGGGRNQPTPTAAELDAQLDAYVNKIK